MASPKVNLSPAEDSDLNEDRALSLLKNIDLPTVEIGELTAHVSLMKSRKVRLALAAHPRTPRRIVLRLIREFYTFELARFALMPSPAPDLKRTAEESLIARMASVTLGERIALARRSSPRVAAALLLDRNARVWQPALENARVAEVAIVKALQSPHVALAFVGALSRHAKWSVRPEIRIALLRNPHTPMARALEFARLLPPAKLRDVLHTSRLPEKIKSYLRKELLSMK